MNLENIVTIEKLYGKLPKIYHDCLSEGMAETDDYRTYSIDLFNVEQVSKISVAPEDCEIDEMKPVALEGLIPIASFHNVDLWVLDNQRGGRIIRVPHDDNEASLFAPSMEAWIYRLCLEEASDFPDEDEVVQAGLARWGKFLSRYAPAWGEHIIKLSKTPYSEDSNGVISDSEVENILRKEFKEEELLGYVKFLRLEKF